MDPDVSRRHFSPLELLRNGTRGSPLFGDTKGPHTTLESKTDLEPSSSEGFKTASAPNPTRVGKVAPLRHDHESAVPDVSGAALDGCHGNRASKSSGAAALAAGEVDVISPPGVMIDELDSRSSSAGQPTRAKDHSRRRPNLRTKRALVELSPQAFDTADSLGSDMLNVVTSTPKKKDTRQNTRSPRRNTKSRRQNTRSPREITRSPRRNTRSPRENTRSSRESTTSPRRNTKSRRQNTRSPREITRSPRRNTRSPRENTRSSRESTTSPRRNTKSRRQNTRSPRENTRSSRENTTSPRESTRSPQRNTTSPRENTRSSRGSTRSPRRNSRSPREKTRSPLRYASSPRENTRIPRKNTRSPKENTENPPKRTNGAPKRKWKRLPESLDSGSEFLEFPAVAAEDDGSSSAARSGGKTNTSSSRENTGSLRKNTMSPRKRPSTPKRKWKRLAESFDNGSELLVFPGVSAEDDSSSSASRGGGKRNTRSPRENTRSPRKSPNGTPKRKWKRLAESFDNGGELLECPAVAAEDDGSSLAARSGGKKPRYHVKEVQVTPLCVSSSPLLLSVGPLSLLPVVRLFFPLLLALPSSFLFSAWLSPLLSSCISALRRLLCPYVNVFKLSSHCRLVSILCNSDTHGWCVWLKHGRCKSKFLVHYCEGYLIECSALSCEVQKRFKLCSISNYRIAKMSRYES